MQLNQDLLNSQQNFACRKWFNMNLKSKVRLQLLR